MLDLLLPLRGTLGTQALKYPSFVHSCRAACQRDRCVNTQRLHLKLHESSYGQFKCEYINIKNM